MATKKEMRMWKQVCEKWEKIIEGNELDCGISNCAWCNEYWDYECKGCPINTFSNNKFCDNTPYADWYNYCGKNNKKSFYVDESMGISGYRIFDMMSTELAKNMLSFVKHLRPE